MAQAVGRGSVGLCFLPTEKIANVLAEDQAAAAGHLSRERLLEAIDEVEKLADWGQANDNAIWD